MTKTLTSPYLQNSMTIHIGLSVHTPMSFTIWGWSNCRMVSVKLKPINRKNKHSRENKYTIHATYYIHCKLIISTHVLRPASCQQSHYLGLVFCKLWLQPGHRSNHEFCERNRKLLVIPKTAAIEGYCSRERCGLQESKCPQAHRSIYLYPIHIP